MIFALTDSNTSILVKLNAIAGNSQYNIVTSVVGGDLKVDLKDKYGNDFSVTNLGYFKIGSTVREITSALSTTLPAGSSWMDLGSSKHAGLEKDLFVFLGWNVATSKVMFGITRYPGGKTLADYNIVSDVVEKSMPGTNFTSAVSTDQVECIGRFNAILSAGAGYTWSIPATSLIISEPIYETRKLSWLPTYTGGGSMTFSSTSTGFYQLVNNRCHIWLNASGTTGGSASTDILATLPFSQADSYIFSGQLYDADYLNGIFFFNSATQMTFRKSSNWNLAASKEINVVTTYSIT